MIHVMLRCNIIPEFRAQCPDVGPFPQRVPTSPRRETSLLNLPGLNGPGIFFAASTAAACDSAPRPFTGRRLELWLLRDWRQPAIIRIDAVNLENVLRDIQTNRGNFHRGRVAS